ncbi:glycosyltransferase family 15 protein [Sclerotinia borealis F-4128]|uniref:Glycosyltransferase family 15 protein n=1 Tax=Sclerotinia borealis (strain F-4128) TaxID=1432307 RepID=W9CHK7_SCLBF|nr:glycosyltransferase family 15 protein [Sclerotinia borealis F-4128]
MAVARPIRVLGLVAIGLWIFFLYQVFGPERVARGPGDTLENPERDPNLDPTGEPEGVLWRADQGYGLGAQGTSRINATLLSLVRNEEVDGMIQAMQDLERTWNHKFNYPWTFFNDVPFTEEFKRRTSAETSAECKYELIPKEHWDIPSWIDKELFEESAKILKENDIQYASMASYHQMCRWNSGLFYKHPAMLNMQFYWRVEPKVHFFCDVDYDVFRYMQDQNKTYGFTINLYDAPQSIPTLWPETTKFLAAHPEYINENNAMNWITDSARRPDHNEKAGGYSTCHFWSNFEIGNMDFWRSQAYEDYFNHLDRAGGFFYERWGDAPVHSSVTSVTSISPTSTALIRPNAKGARRDDSQTEKLGYTRRIADQIGSNTSVQRIWRLEKVLDCNYLLIAYKSAAILQFLNIDDKMSNFENTIEEACRNRDIPGTVLVCGNNSGKFHYAKAFGSQSLEDPSNPMNLKSVMWFASCTKLLTTIAAMQCVERGLLSLDGDICEVLPEFKGVQILTGFDEENGKPILIDNHKTITLRHLLTHSSGLAYDMFDPLLSRYQAYLNKSSPVPMGGPDLIKDLFKFPLLFAPGDSWSYGVGIDWVGQMVERVNGNISLEDYLAKNVWGPLGMNNITFRPLQNPEILARLISMSTREGGNLEGKAIYTSKVLFDPATKDCHGGVGTFGSPVDYFKCLQSLCANDGQLLKSETIDEMFRPQLSEDSRKGLMETISIPEVNACFGAFPKGLKADWGLGGIMNLEDIGGRSKGSIAWGGYPNLNWWIDRKNGICGIWGSQLEPPGDPKINQLFHTFEEEMYRRTSASREKL